MRSPYLRPAAAVPVVLTVLTVLAAVVLTAGPADAATAKVMYRGTSNVRPSVTGLPCRAGSGSVPLTAESSTSLVLGDLKPSANSRDIVCTTGAVFSGYIVITLAETIGWNSAHAATAQHWAQVSEVTLFGLQRCIPTTADAENKIRINSQQQGTVTAEFTKAERTLTALRSVKCPQFGNRTVSLTFTESWSAVA
jgi:hypothetical protein